MENSLRQFQLLLNKAKEDLAAATKLIEDIDYSEEIVLFHCQQAIEKALKAFLDARAVTFPKSHDLSMLLSLCIEKDPSFEQIGSIVELTQYAVEARYDEVVEIPEEEVAETVKQTEKAFSFIINKLPQ
jgi:HEPN domain-containing protein